MTKLSQISNTIVADIEAGVLRDGDQLPSEEKLAAVHGVSVGTVQKALARLASSGLISREHGRGTFVSGTSVAPAEVRYLRFRDDEGNELPSFVHVRSVRRTTRAGPWSDFSEAKRSCASSARSMSADAWTSTASSGSGKADFARLGGVSRRALEKNLRALWVSSLRCPRCAQTNGFALRRFLRPPRGCSTQARGARLHYGVAQLHAARPHLYYQSLYSRPFSERLVIVR